MGFCLVWGCVSFGDGFVVFVLLCFCLFVYCVLWVWDVLRGVLCLVFVCFSMGHGVWLLVLCWFVWCFDWVVWCLCLLVLFCRFVYWVLFWCVVLSGVVLFCFCFCVGFFRFCFICILVFCVMLFWVAVVLLCGSEGFGLWWFLACRVVLCVCVFCGSGCVVRLILVLRWGRCVGVWVLVGCCWVLVVGCIRLFYVLFFLVCVCGGGLCVVFFDWDIWVLCVCASWVVVFFGLFGCLLVLGYALFFGVGLVWGVRGYVLVRLFLVWVCFLFC